MAVSKSWMPGYLSSGITRRRLLGGMVAGVGAGFILACGGNESSQLINAKTPREPGSVWFSKNNYLVPDESKQGVRGGIYRGVRNANLESNYDLIVTGQGTADFVNHTHETMLFRNRGPGVDPKSLDANRPVGSLAESWEVSNDGLTVVFTCARA